MKHLIFYDGQCPLCNRAICKILAWDKKKQFYFAPLGGKTAKKKISHVYVKNPSLDTLVLLQNSDSEKGQLLTEGRAVLRIMWLLGGWFKILGWLSFLPSAIFDYIYRLVARNRYKLFCKRELFDSNERFLE